MAGSKSPSVYSLDKASAHLSAALALIDKNPASVSNEQLAEFFVSYALLLNIQLKISALLEMLTRYLLRIDKLGDDPKVVVIRHHYVFALFWNTRYREAAAIQRVNSLIADRPGGGVLWVAARRRASPSQRKIFPNLASQMRTAFSSIAWNTGCRRLLQRFRKVSGALTQFIELPRTLDGYHGPSGKVLHKRDLFIAEWPDFLAVNADHSYSLVLFEHRHT
jgi:hypothetical protein